jgi:hypothetical protein
MSSSKGKGYAYINYQISAYKKVLFPEKEKPINEDTTVNI